MLFRSGSLMELKDLGGVTESVGVMPLIVSFIVAAIAGYFAIALIKKLVVSDKFRLFAYYTLALGIIVLTIGIYEKVTGNRIGVETTKDILHALIS